MALVSINDEPTGRSLVVAEPRQRDTAMRAARRHTLVVRALRLVFPAIAVVLLASYWLFMQRTVEIAGDTHVGTLNTGTLSLSSTRPTMHNPSYVGFNRKDGSEYVIRAKQALTDLSDKKPVDLIGISGELKQRDGVTTKMTATEGKYFRKDERLKLFKEIDIQSTNGMSARLSVADISMTDSTIRSSKPVEVKFPAGTLRGNSMLLRQKQREVIFSQGVAARLRPEKSGKAKPAAQAGQPQGGLVAFAGQSDEPVDVWSQSLFIKDDMKSARFSGNVRARQGEAQLQAQLMDIYYSGSAVQDAASGGGSGNASSSVNRIIARGNVIITRNQDRVVSKRADFDVQKNKAVLDGGVVMTSGDDRRVMGDTAKIDTAADSVELIGRVIISQADNILRGSRLYYDQRNGLMKLTRPAAPGRAAGRISARFSSPNQEQAPGKRKASAKAANGNLLANPDFRTEPGAPIEIEAAVLDIDDKRRVATFRGNVVATQGSFQVKTAVLQAVYTGDAGLALQPGEPQGAPANQRRQAAQLKSIHAPQKVTVVSGEGRKAVGNGGSFDVALNRATLNGKVVLTQGRQVIRGEKLNIDLNSGLSKMLTANGWSTVKNNGRESVRGPRLQRGTVPKAADVRKCRSGRMCAVFYPNEMKKQAKKVGKQVEGAVRSGQPAAPKTGGASAPVLGSSWSASTTSGGN